MLLLHNYETQRVKSQRIALSYDEKQGVVPLEIGRRTLLTRAVGRFSLSHTSQRNSESIFF